MGLTEQDRKFGQWSLSELLAKAQEVPQMPDQEDEEWGFSERSSWWEAITRHVRIRLFYLGEEYDHLHPDTSSEELDREWDALQRIRAALGE
jgi:hypothetical protein